MHAAKAVNCTQGCTLHGVCNEELGRCDCHRTRTGAACELQLTGEPLKQRCKSSGFSGVSSCTSEKNTCPNNCLRRGTCVAGFCLCQPGFFGNDCALSMAPAGPNGTPTPAVLSDRGYTPRAAGPRVYIYDLPPELTTWRNDDRLDRWTTRHFLEMLTASGARVGDPKAADWFYLPVRLRSSSDGHVLRRALEYVQAAQPWFNATGGRNHFVMAVGDMGRLESERGPLSANVTFVSHWGLSTSKAEQLKSPHWRASHRNATDIVLPVYLALRKLQKFGILNSRHHPKFTTLAPPDVRERNGPLLWFAGRVCQDSSPPRTDVWPNCPKAMGYSAMTRQAVYFHHWNRTGFQLLRGDKQYAKHLLTSKFCFGPMGGGHGQRQFQAALAGCVPVVIGDGVLEAWEPYLDWNQFGVRVAEADIPRLHTILAGIGPEEYARKVRSLRCAAQHMAFSSVTGAYMGESGRFDAFETLLAVLAARARHPDTPQERLRQVDPALDAFMDCREGPGAAVGGGGEEGGKGSAGGNGAGVDAAGEDAQRLNSAPAAGKAQPLCSVSPYDKADPGVTLCSSLYRNPFQPPAGGLRCAGAGDVAACARAWA
ncbi:hypothetical protein HXX76_002028 [Chlamydomonas incerta]|uniref:EGF-like domain-containing protein n=1 Tax=Chlamydomonas incerta TaxID=51695 RepID=A0A835WAA5_CHLIN|nr:hypothetical protein HXX76_002028 [Chlamydomonas incerta]|eukprot:KAG2443680.1 hypothetical protein HXX76_002028 [Chlamydomonas incerta]